MGRGLRWVGFGLVGLGAVVGAGIGYLKLAFPVMPEPETRTVTATPELLTRGAYLAEHVAVCTDCHSERDYTRFSAPIIPGTLGKGGERFGHELGFPCELVAPNITPHALSSWSDGELVRALTVGVTPDGRALFPLMNYPAYQKLCRADLDALVTYLRSLPSIDAKQAASTLDFPLNLIIPTLPKEVVINEHCPDPKDSVKYGQYLVETAGCVDCHTQHDGPDRIAELAYAGGMEMKLPGGGSVFTKNITPHASGIGSWSRETFLARFAAYRQPENLHKVERNDPNTLMPWSMYAGMTDEDLGAIYDFLRTVKPVDTKQAKVATR